MSWVIGTSCWTKMPLVEVPWARDNIKITREEDFCKVSTSLFAFCPDHDNKTVTLYAKFQSDLSNGKEAMVSRDIARFKFKKDFLCTRYQVLNIRKKNIASAISITERLSHEIKKKSGKLKSPSRVVSDPCNSGIREPDVAALKPAPVNSASIVTHICINKLVQHWFR